jgi:Tfp pilus assembly protein PilO
MNDLEVQLDNLDEQLQEYEPRQRWFIYIGSALGILVMGWMFYLSDTLDELSALQDQNSALIAQIADNSDEAYKAKITQSVNALTKEEAKRASLENEKQALLLEMAANQGLLFDNRHYAKMLDILLERSVKLGLKIELMESVDSDKVFFGKVKQFKKLTVTGTGNFRSIADFLTFIESQNTLVEIQSVQIRADGEKPRFVAVILYMGVAL